MEKSATASCVRTMARMPSGGAAAATGRWSCTSSPGMSKSRTRRRATTGRRLRGLRGRRGAPRALRRARLLRAVARRRRRRGRALRARQGAPPSSRSRNGWCWSSGRTCLGCNWCVPWMQLVPQAAFGIGRQRAEVASDVARDSGLVGRTPTPAPPAAEAPHDLCGNEDGRAESPRRTLIPTTMPTR